MEITILTDEMHKRAIIQVLDIDILFLKKDIFSNKSLALT